MWTTNNNPLVIGRFYFEYLFKSRGRIFGILVFTLFTCVFFFCLYVSWKITSENIISILHAVLSIFPVLPQTLRLD